MGIKQDVDVHKKAALLKGPLLGGSKFRIPKVLINFTGLNLQGFYLPRLTFTGCGLDAPGLSRSYLPTERDRQNANIRSIPLKLAQLLLFLLLLLGQEFIVFLAVFI